ncbi:DMT family transporter [Marimonas arenosa]|uniref:DMT family transporter n=1 Tax=Marimonas arenosa TaxID=1795305 RepID=A0AAE4B5N5_9RHOB|nr:DMT family transporter [Marimonas arenosa]MDQ2090514.1 DMT family transporter [Marimonas arenosa]
MTFWIALPVVIAAGVAASLQAPVNAALARVVENSLLAAAVSFGVGFSVLSLVVLVTGGGGDVGRLSGAAWWMFLGGALGAFYVWGALWGVPVLGVVTMVSALILGQMVAALVVDYVGAFGLPVRELSLPRVLGAGLVAVGVVLSRF